MAALVGESAAATQSEAQRQKARILALADAWSKAQKLKSHGGAQIGVRGKEASALIASAAYSPIGRAGRLSSEYKGRSELARRLALRTKKETAAPRLAAAKSGNGRNLAGPRIRREHPGVASEGGEAEHRRIAARKNSPLAQESLRAERAQRASERLRPALTVNFSPTVVLRAEPDQAAKKNIVEALSRHSHELVELIEHEIAKQRRVEFGS